MFKILLIIGLFISSSYAFEKDDYDLLKSISFKNSQITKLRFNNRPDIKNLQFLHHFPNLTRLSIIDCPNIKDLEKSLLPYAKKLKKLTLCRLGLTTVSFLSSFTNLEALNLSINYDLDSIAPLSNLSKLKSLNLSGCYPIRDISLLGEMTKLKKLGLSQVLMRYSSITPPIPTSLHFLEPLASNLEYLDLRCCDLDSLSPLYKFHNLRYLYLNGACDRIKKWEGLESLEKLEYLDLGDAQYRMKSFRFLNILPHLKKVYIQEEEKIPFFKKRSGLKVGSKVHLHIHEW